MVARRHAPLSLLAMILAVVLVVDVVAAATVYVKRRNAPDFPEFARAEVTAVNWDVEPYPSAAPDDFSVEISAPGRIDPTGRVTYREGAVFPSLSATYVIAALEKAERMGSDLWLRRAVTAMDQVLRTSQDGFLPHRFADTDVFGRSLPNPWYSGQAQGLVLSALARLYEVTGEARWRTSSDPVFQTLTTFRGFLAGSQPAAEPWLDVVDSAGYVWFEAFTHGRAPTMILARHMQATVGIYDYQRVLADRPAETRLARRLFSAGLATVQRYAPLSRTPGKVSVTSLVSGQRDPADHNVVEKQLSILSRMVNDTSLARIARLLDQDDDLPTFNAAGIAPRDADVSVYDPLPDEPAFRVDPPLPTRVTPSGRVTYREGAINPAMSASYALASLDRYETTDQQLWLDRAKMSVNQVLDSSRRGLLPYRFSNSDIYGFPLPEPWYSAEGQGLMLSALARLYRLTGDPVWRTRSRDVFLALTRVRDISVDGAPPPRAWLSFVDDSGYLWFEQYAGGVAASLVVPGHLAGLLGVYDYWQMSRSPVAKALFDGGATTVRHYLPRIRRDGRAPWYAVGNKSSDSRFEATVTRQLVTLGRITEDKQIQRFAVQ